MVCQPVRLALLIGAITAVSVMPARASHTQAPCNSCSSGCGATAPAFRTITCTECVPETYTVKRCAYRVECKTEQYNYCRTECFPVCKERVCTVVDRVPCMKTVTKRVCSYTTTYQQKCVTKMTYSYVNQTCMQKKCVSRGHWDCQCVQTCMSKLKQHCNPCACPDYKQKKVWVSCPEYIECPVTVCKKICVPTQVMCTVPVCTPVWNEVQCQVCSYTCVPRQVVTKYTCYETRSIPCTGTRTVRCCVPYEENVTCTRWVSRQVCRQVPCEAPCTTTCNNSCTDSCAPATCCETSCCSKPRHKRCGGLFAGRHNSSCCR